MRFALIATTAAAALAVPLAVAATAPQMSDQDFIAAVRCTAYEDAQRPDAALAEAKWRLNSEARRQSIETAVTAQAEASAAARQAVSGAGGEIAANCGALLANATGTV
jgi:hypothetical protein